MAICIRCKQPCSQIVEGFCPKCADELYQQESQKPTPRHKKCRIIVNTKFDAVHCWEQADDDVEFLRHLHHHQFLVTVEIETIPGDMNRSLEFFRVRRCVDQIIANSIPWHDEFEMHTLEGMSCEALADVLNAGLRTQLSLDDREVRVRIMEDGYAGSETTYTGEQKYD